ncbi:uncharacterized protein LOC129739249 isoform X2 [Uranotaenia lowii]|uniref:uncharacterized protein LOC129739249 isoform X2 n=1 Tax=Uranotaenia lowii TaxID=190385 RepID=UPI00247AB2D6|nr:uncharacterized protein LOC129739249 isoform X2 [Uranotaenia lowii]
MLLKCRVPPQFPKSQTDDQNPMIEIDLQSSLNEMDLISPISQRDLHSPVTNTDIIHYVGNESSLLDGDDYGDDYGDYQILELGTDDSHHDHSDRQQSGTMQIEECLPSTSSSEQGSLLQSNTSCELVKSNKRSATDMKFESFRINWDKISDNLLLRLEKMQCYENEHPDCHNFPIDIDFSNSFMCELANQLVDQLVLIDLHVPASVQDFVAKEVYSKYPCLHFRDDDGFKTPEGHQVLKRKMINRVSYKKRYSGNKTEQLPKRRKHRIVRSGTIENYWQEKSSSCEPQLYSLLLRDEPNVTDEWFLQKSQPFVRYIFSNEENIAENLKKFPIIRRRKMLSFHFEKCTGIALDTLGKYYSEKKHKIIDYSLRNKKKNLNANSTDFEIFEYLAALVDEDFKDLMSYQKLGTCIEEIRLDGPDPMLAHVDLGNNSSIYYVFAEELRLSEGTDDIVTAVSDLMAVHFVHNFVYRKQCSKFLELIQQYLLKIYTKKGGKSQAVRKGTIQCKVAKVIESISRHVISKSALSI